MRKMMSIVLLLIVVGVLAACGNKDGDDEVITDAPELEQLLVELTVTNEVEVGETVDMSAFVTIGDRKIDKADEVVYEVWEEGKKSESIMIDSKNEGEGVYTAETSFDHDGIFHIQVHVTAEVQHMMPVEQVTVGEGGEYEESADYHTEGFSMHFMEPKNAKAGDEAALITHIELNEEALEELNVRYEIWHEDDEDDHHWADATEGNAGEYSASYVFEEAGDYTIAIHVEDDDALHEHEEHVVTVEE